MVVFSAQVFVDATCCSEGEQPCWPRRLGSTAFCHTQGRVRRLAVGPGHSAWALEPLGGMSGTHMPRGTS